MKVKLIGLIVGWMLVFSGSRAAAAAAESGKAKGDGAAKLENYSWTEVISDSVDGKTAVSTVAGKVDGTGVTAISVITTNRTVEGYLRGNKAYVTCAQRNWRSEPRLAKGERPGEFMTRLVRSVTPPAQEIELLLKKSEKLKPGDDSISADLSEGTARKLLETASKQRKGGEKAKGATGNVTFWTRDGAVTKYEVKLKGKVEVDGKDEDLDRTRMIEIKDIGATTVVLPEKAKRKLEN